LFGLLAVQLAVSVSASQGNLFTDVLAGIFLLISMFFVHRSFYGMRIESTSAKEEVSVSSKVA
jgi:K(+)-stimulated pyrophosphate-energized sodium pump